MENGLRGRNELKGGKLRQQSPQDACSWRRQGRGSGEGTGQCAQHVSHEAPPEPAHKLTCSCRREEENLGSCLRCCHLQWRSQGRNRRDKGARAPEVRKKPSLALSAAWEEGERKDVSTGSHQHGRSSPKGCIHSLAYAGGRKEKDFGPTKLLKFKGE